MMPMEGTDAMTCEPTNGRRHRRLALWCLLALCLCSGSAAMAQSADVCEAGEAGATGVLQTGVRYAIDFDYLTEAVPNAVAWLYQPNTTINQPVMFSTDEQYYLRRQFNNGVSSNGAIFTTGEAAPDFSDAVVTLYGRNNMDFSLFGSLSNYMDDEYYRQNPTLYLLTPAGDYRLDIFAGMRLKQSDAASPWRVSAENTKALADILPRVLESSFLTPIPALLPGAGDAWAVLATEATDTQGVRYVLYARKRAVRYANTQTVYVNQMDMDSRRTLNKRVRINGVGSWMTYAQNDPLWDDLTFETERCNRRRSFGDGGCGPTAIAMAIANLVDKEALVKLGEYARSPFGFRFCTCSVNEYWCSRRHLAYQITTPDEYLRYFPLAIANFACGNNLWGVQGRSNGYGTSMRYLDQICEVFGISITKAGTAGEAVELLRAGNAMGVACTVGPGPFTKTSHFVTLAGADDKYLYILDPLRRTGYGKWDGNGYLEIITPGLVRVSLENAGRCNLAPIYILSAIKNP